MSYGGVPPARLPVSSWPSPTVDEITYSLISLGRYLKLAITHGPWDSSLLSFSPLLGIFGPLWKNSALFSFPFFPLTPFYLTQCLHALLSLPASSNIQHWGIWIMLPRWRKCLALVFNLWLSLYFFKRGGEKYPCCSLHHHHQHSHIRSVDNCHIHQTSWKILFQLVSLKTSFFVHGLLYFIW